MFALKSNVMFYGKRMLMLKTAGPGTQAAKYLLSSWDYEFANDGMAGHTYNLDEALQESFILGDVDSATKLIAKGANIDAPDFEGKTPLMLALFFEHPKCALALLDAGCDVYPQERVFGNRALSYALNGEVTPEVIQVIERMLPGAAQRYDDQLLGYTPLHGLTYLIGDEGLLQHAFNLLLDSGQDIDAGDDEGETPINRAVSQDSLAVFSLFHAAGACMTSITRHGLGILHRAGNFAGRELLDRLGQVNLSMDMI